MGRVAAWSPEDIAAVEVYLADGKGPAEIRRLRPEWSISTLKKLAGRFHTEGGLHAGGGGRPCSISEETKARVKEYVQANPKTSVTQVQKWLLSTHGVNLSHTSAFRLMKEDYKPFKMVIHQKISEKNAEWRLSWCRRMKMRTQAHTKKFRLTTPVRPLDIEKCWFIDEKFFRLDPGESSQNVRIWLDKGGTKAEHYQGPAKDTLLHATNQSLRTQGFMVCCAVNQECGITTPYVVPANCKIDAAAYVDILQNHIAPAILAMTGPGSSIIQDNAPGHCAATAKQFYKDILTANSLEVIQQPASSPDLNPLDFYYWHAMAKEHGQQPSREQAIARLLTVAQRINDEWERHQAPIASSFLQRLPACIGVGGGHFEM